MVLNLQGPTPHVCCAQVALTQLPNHEHGLHSLFPNWRGLSLLHTHHQTHARILRPASRAVIPAHVWTDLRCLYLLQHMQAIAKHSASLSVI